MKFAALCLCCALLCAGAGCTSTPQKSSAGGTETGEAGAKPKGPAYLLRMIDYRSGVRCELVNPSHTTALEQYSQVRTDASRKVTSEEWMSELVKFLKNEGWSKEEKRGSAPTSAPGSLRWSLELTGPEGTSYIAAAMDAKGSQAARLIKLKAAFLDAYNATPAFQAKQLQPGEPPFKVPDYQAPAKKSGG